LCQQGPHADQCVRLIKELAQAKATLTDAKKRAEYLAILPNGEPVKPVAPKPAAPKPVAPKPAPSPATVKKSAVQDDLSALAAGPPTPVRRPKKSKLGLVLVGTAAVVVLLAVGVWVAVAVVLNSPKPQAPTTPGVAINTHPVQPTNSIPPGPPDSVI